MTPASSAPLPLGMLLSNTLSFVRGYWKPVLTAAVLFGTIGALIGGGVAHRATAGMNGVMNQMGIDANQMQELSARIKNGDQTAVADMEKLLNDRAASMGAGADAMVKSQIIGMFGPLIGIAALIGFVVFVLSYSFFLLLAIHPTQDAMSVLRKTPGVFFPLIGLWIWIALRSFIWIPIIGIIPAIILGPRFALAPVLMVSEKKGIMESARISYERTTGYWGKIVGNMIVAVLCVAVTSMVVGIVIGIVGLLLPSLGFWLESIVKEVFSGFMTIFGVQLTMTLLSHPMKMKK